MKLAFLLLVLVNVALFAWQHGVFGRFAESGREPERIARQVEPERIRVLSEREVQVLRERAAAQSRAAAVAAPPSAANGAVIDLSVAQSCVEFGDFIGPDLSRVETALLRLGLGSRQSARTVEAPGWYLVYLPPFKTRAEADRAVADLKKSGVKDLLVFTDGPLRLAMLLRRRVIFMVGLYRGGNRYDVRFESLVDFRHPPADLVERERLVRSAVADYVRRLETLCREAPYNWFNFYDYWDEDGLA